ncbi:MAG TPA: TonB family protein [Verrucomicrobiae bacterium]|nr:TonB family protein [Verrucomicrobiae bacterium]
MAAPPIAERPARTRTPRRVARHRVAGLMYLDLGSGNGGFPINISEDGMAFQGVVPLEQDQEICVKFKLDGIDETVTATAKIVWLTETRKGGGLQFIDLPEASRRHINDWIALQERGGRPIERPAAAISPVEQEGSRPVPAVPLVADRGDTPTQSIPVFTIQLPSSSLPAGNAAPVIAQNDASDKAELLVNLSQPKLPSDSSAGLKRPSQVPAQPAKDKKKHSWVRSSVFMLGLAASIAMIVVSGAILWPLRGALLGHSVSDNPAQKVIQPASAPIAALPPEKAAVVEPSSDPTTFESLPLAPIANAQENPTVLSPLNVTTSGSSHPVENPKPLAPKINPRTTTKVPASPIAAIRPAAPAIVPAQAEQSVAGPANPVPEDRKQLPAAAPAEERASSLSPKLPENSLSATGSIEIIPDPYPSILVPAESKARLSRPGTSLQIGQLVSKGEPVYPPEALRQRMAGTVKVHVVIGVNGTVEKAEPLNGQSLLEEAALRAVQQWRYEPTLLGSEAIEVEEDITLVFRITSPPPAAN